MGIDANPSHCQRAWFFMETQLLGVEFGGNPGRAGKIAEHHREIAALAGRLGERWDSVDGDLGRGLRWSGCDRDLIEISDAPGDGVCRPCLPGPAIYGFGVRFYERFGNHMSVLRGKSQPQKGLHQRTLEFVVSQRINSPAVPTSARSIRLPLSTPFSFIAATAAMFAVRLILGAKPDVTGHCRKRRS
jgi:hypothetical protein